MRKAVITGMGVNSCAGTGVEEFFRNLDSPTDKRLFTDSLPFKLDLKMIYGKAADSAFDKPMKGEEFNNPTSRLCLNSARECIESAKANGLDHKIDTLIVGTSTGGQEVCEDYFCSLLQGKSTEILFLGQGTMASPTRCISSEFDLEARVQTISTACTSSANAIALGASLIENEKSKVALVGGGDAICRTTLSGFSILGLTGLEPCRPFGLDRPGMTLGEGSAFLLLEDKETVLNEGRPYFAELSGYGFSSDAYSMTSPCEDGRGAIEAMSQALVKAGLKSEDISFVNAHGTGTVFNDRSEAMAISSIFSNNLPVSSLKGLVGHTLGASGAIEAIASIYSLIRKRGFPNYYSYERGNDCFINLTPPNGIELDPNKSVLSNSFAFGGNNCALIFSKGNI